MSTPATRPITATISVLAIGLIAAAVWYGTKPYHGGVPIELPYDVQPTAATPATPATYKTLFGKIPIELPTREYVNSLKPAARADLHAETMAKIAAMPAWVSSDAMPGGAGDGSALRQLAIGELKTVDDLHSGHGNVMLLQLPDGSAVLRFEDFKVGNGPDLQVFLARAADPLAGNPTQYDGVRLGRLKGNVGNQNYPLPDNPQADEFHSVVVYCELFGDVYLMAQLN